MALQYPSEIYPAWESKGRKLWQWMSNPAENSCKISKTSLTFSYLLGRPRFSIFIVDEASEDGKTPLLRHIGGVPVEKGTNGHEVKYRSTDIVSYRYHPTRIGVEWFGFSELGMLFLSWISRPDEPCEDPYTAEIAKAVYEKDFPLDTLKRVFVTHIINEDTRDLLNRLIIENSEMMGIQSWEYPEPEFSALLGTRIGSTVAYLVLCAYGQGVKCVSKITFVAEDVRTERLRYDLIFDIETVS
ncbi:hypothetical protein N7450_000483 [Penicillium hetheringtonii]|uniref:Uncharacterized protein n=1 Tax=Penicillium hetheringtonii TaxID=911720 RepID=A0AAD6H1T8_9EURO|nr:hypothetical protein N7450_000483 [Penicillium hetheringtonii]